MSLIYDFRRFLEQCTRFFDFCTQVFDQIAENSLVLSKVDKIEHIFCTFRAGDLFLSTLKLWKIFEFSRVCRRKMSSVFFRKFGSLLNSEDGNFTYVHVQWKKFRWLIIIEIFYPLIGDILSHDRKV